MASDEDLIDLYVCVANIVPEMSQSTSETQTHLLDVRPPELEQKLSLSSEHTSITQHGTNGDILVTLGHDQVVPKHKRIDVVSLETIKRIRNITKNLEPVIKASQQQEQMQNGASNRRSEDCYVKHSSESEKSEDQAMSAFDFLSEIDDNESNQETCDLIEAVNLEEPCVKHLHESKMMAYSRSPQDSVMIDTNNIDSNEPSTSAGFKASARFIRRSEVPSTSSSECSEVDWTWVEDYQRSAPATSMSRTSSPSGRSTFLVSEFQEPLPLPPGRMRPSSSVVPVLSSQLSNDSAVMYVDTAGKSIACTFSDNVESITSTSTTTFETASEGSQDLRNSATCQVNSAVGESPASSWLRASMRRLRRLRLPETESIDLPARQTSAPTSLPDIALVAPEILAAHTNGTILGTVQRPSSAPAARNGGATPISRNTTPRRGRQRTRSTSRENSSPVASPANRSSASNPNNSTQSERSPQYSNLVRRIQERQYSDEREDESGQDDEQEENPLGKWPHSFCPAFAYLSCTLGLFNISRFSILSVQFGANFIVQFVILSLILGIPLLTLDVCLGQRLSAGAVDMWKISPIFQGVGIALLMAHAFIGIYSIIGVSWMFVYFRDSFIAGTVTYHWAEPKPGYRDDTKSYNYSAANKLHETVPDYFNAVVLQRDNLNGPDPGVFSLKFQVAFNLAAVWVIVFVSLSKGLRSYGKVVYVVTIIPVCGFILLCVKLLGFSSAFGYHQLFPKTVWNEFFTNTSSWEAASSEVFLTWGLLGAAAMQMAAHNKHKHLLQRDTSIAIILTFLVLIMAAFLANACVEILRSRGYDYSTSSFENMTTYIFMHPTDHTTSTSGYKSNSFQPMSCASFIIGQRIFRHGTGVTLESRYQALRLATELVPAAFAALGAKTISPFWAILFYFVLILFGIAQQLAIWHCVITGIMAINAKVMKLWETTITFFSCACGYVLGLSMATEFGIYVVYYLDYTVGGAWWIIVLYLTQIGAVFAVRGRPHTGEAVVAELFTEACKCFRHWAAPLLSFTWNVVLPVTLMVMTIIIFRNNGFRDLYSYARSNKDYWPDWAKQLGAAIQLIPILTIVAVAIIQTRRYLKHGPPDIFDRIQLLYRPSLRSDGTPHPQPQLRNNSNMSVTGNGILPVDSDGPFEDAPPKYTPPPSYSTATGARIAKMLRQSFRRSVRRITSVLGESSTQRTRSVLEPPPPDYATVLVEMNQSIIPEDILESQPPDVTDTGCAVHVRLRPNTIDVMTRPCSLESNCPVERTHSTIDRNRRLHNNGSSNLTAADVASLLRSSIRRGTTRTQQNLGRSLHPPVPGASVENLVNAVAPIGQTIALVREQQTDSNDHEDKKTVEMDNSISVI